MNEGAHKDAGVPVIRKDGTGMRSGLWDAPAWG